jgi:hypothetical protein
VASEQLRAVDSSLVIWPDPCFVEASSFDGDQPRRDLVDT